MAFNIHASCAARGEAGVLLIGAPGSGKSDLLLRLLDHGFSLVADDRVLVEGRMARAPDALAGLLEVRGLGVVRLPFRAAARIELVAGMASPAASQGASQNASQVASVARMPAVEAYMGVPFIRLDPRPASAPAKLAIALGCLRGDIPMVAGAFA